MRRLVLAGLVLAAAGPAPDPDWPCVQRLVPTLTASTLWGGHEAAGDWRADPRLAAVVPVLARRSLPAPAAAAQLERFVADVPEAERAVRLPELFQGLVDETNTQRAEVIGRLRDRARHQRLLTETVSRITGELRALPPDAEAATREEITTRRTLLIREYDEIERTIRYACEVPVQMEAKLGVLAGVLGGALGR